MSEPAIETRGLTKRFGDVLAVDSVSMTVERGEVYGSLGPNVAGKSTTINVLLDLLRPTEGSARVLGHHSHAAPRSLRRRTAMPPERA